MSSFEGQTIAEMRQWVEDNPGKFDGVVERLRMIEEMETNRYAHYYGYKKPID